MMKAMVRILVARALIATGIALLLPCTSFADQFPTRPVRLIVGFAPGGIADVVTRVTAQALSQQLGQPVVVENKPGADSRIALQQLASSTTPDGYSILLSDASLIVNAVLSSTRNYDALKDFTPLLYVGEVPNFIAVGPAVPANTLTEFIGYAKANQGRLNYAAGGGSTMLGTELFKSAANVDIKYIPYKGQTMGLTALMGGDVHLMVSSVGPLAPLVKQGRIKALAVTSRKRTSLAPDVPTTTEAGLPAMVYTNWFVILGPAGMPRPVVERLQSALRKVMADASVSTRLKEMGIDSNPIATDEFLAFLRAELTRMESIVKSANLKVE